MMDRLTPPSHSEVQNSMKTAMALYETWQRLLEAGSRADPEEVSWTDNELKSTLSSVEWDLQDLDETIMIVERNPGKFKLSGEEIRSRKGFVEETRASLKRLQEHQMDARGAVASSQRAALMATGSGSVAGGKNSKYARLDEAISKDNDSFVADQMQSRQMMMQDQDRELEVVGDAVARLKNMGGAIGDELDAQARMLDAFDADLDRTESRLSSTMAKLNKLLVNVKDKKSMCTIVLLIFTLVILLVLILTMDNKKKKQ